MELLAGRRCGSQLGELPEAEGKTGLAVWNWKKYTQAGLDFEFNVAFS